MAQKAKRTNLIELLYTEPDGFKKLATEIGIKYGTIRQTMIYRGIKKRSTKTLYARAFNKVFGTQYTTEYLFTEIE